MNDQLYELGTIIKNVIQRLDDLNLKWNISILTSVSWNFFYIIFVLSKLTYLRRPLYLRNKRERPLVKKFNETRADREIENFKRLVMYLLVYVQLTVSVRERVYVCSTCLQVGVVTERAFTLHNKTYSKHQS